MQEQQANERARLETELALVRDERTKLVAVATHPVTKFLLGFAPFAGGPLATLLGDVAQQRQEKRLEEFLLDVASRIQQLDARVSTKLDATAFSSDAGVAVLEGVLSEVATTSDKNKMGFLRDFLIASAMSFRPDVTWQDLLLKYIRDLSGVHLIVLSVFYDVQGHLATSERLGGMERPGLIPLEIGKVAERLGGDDERLIRIAANDLVNLGMLVDWRNLRPSDQTFHDKFVISDNGRMLMRYVRFEWETVSTTASLDLKG